MLSSGFFFVYLVQLIEKSFQFEKVTQLFV
jgi:hypothetical protein